jgi:hypothetical protein
MFEHRAGKIAMRIKQSDACSQFARTIRQKFQRGLHLAQLPAEPAASNAARF